MTALATPAATRTTSRAAGAGLWSPGPGRAKGLGIVAS